MTTVADILDVLEALAPTGMKMDWDNVGLLCGSRKKEVEQVLVALDPFDDQMAATRRMEQALADIRVNGGGVQLQIAQIRE